jgi:hypothetical protein
MRDRLRFLVPIVVTVAMLGCGDDRETPTSPTRPNGSSVAFVGVWSGSMTDEAGSRALRLTITEQVDRTLLGTWASTFQDGSADDGGTASGLLNATGNAVFLTLTSSRSCPPAMAPGALGGNLTIIDNHMNGSLVAFSCTLRWAMVELSKQQ